MDEGEDLCRLRVRAVYERQRRHAIREGESAELARVELPVRVAADDTVHHDKETQVFGVLDQDPESIRPGGATVRNVESKRRAHLGRRRDGIGSSGKRADGIDARLLIHDRELPVPLLPLLALVDGVKQIRARTRHTGVTDRPEIGYRYLLSGRLG